MADVLSQSEIDSLLSALSSGEIEAEDIKKEEEKQRVKIYDFRRPQKFAKEHIRTLELVHDNFSRLCSNYLTGKMRKNSKVKLVSVEQITYEEFIHSVSNPTVLINFKFAPLNGLLTFEFNPSFVFQVIDILFGGTGEKKYVAKEFTEINKGVMERISKEMIECLKTAWEDILEIKPEYDSMENNPALNQTLAPNEPIALLNFSVEIGSNTSIVNLCLPYVSVEEIMDKLVVEYWFENDQKGFKKEYRDQIESKIKGVNIDISVELGISNIMVSDFLKLGIGDIIRLDNLITDPVKVMVENKDCYYAKPGMVESNRGVEILDVIKEEEKNNG
ncbi:MAG: flagellar motor switch protein FliM [Sarcina sp.]